MIRARQGDETDQRRGAGVSQAHMLVGQLAVVLGLIAAAWSIALALARRQGGPLFLGFLIWVVGAVALASLLGVATAVSVAPPRDGLHLVYGVLALAVLPGAALTAVGRPARRQSVVAAVAMIVLVILLFRLIETGS